MKESLLVGAVQRRAVTWTQPALAAAEQTPSAVRGLCLRLQASSFLPAAREEPFHLSTLLLGTSRNQTEVRSHLANMADTDLLIHHSDS